MRMQNHLLLSRGHLPKEGNSLTIRLYQGLYKIGDEEK